MPNLHWFGTEADHRTILSWVFSSDDACVFELYSKYGKEIRSFSSADAVLAGFDMPYSNGETRHSLLLTLWVKASGPQPRINRFGIDPAKCDGATWQERCEAVGFVQFYLERCVDGNLKHSQTNTSSEARLGACDGKIVDQNGTTWDVRATNRFSSKINRMIRKQAVAKIGSAAVMPGAAELWFDGTHFGPHWSKSKTPNLFVQLD